MALLFDSWTLELLAVLITLFAGTYAYFIVKFQYWKAKGVHALPPTFPFGNIADMVFHRLTIGQVFADIYNKTVGHKMVGVYQLNTHSLLLRDPDLVKTFLVKDFAHFHDHGLYFDEESDPISAHLFSMEGIKWKHMRQKLTPTFTSGKMKMMFPSVVSCGKELQDHLLPIAGRKETIEVKEVLAKYSTDVIATCAFGIQSNSMKNPDSEFRTMGRKIFEPTAYTSFRDMIAFLLPSLAKVFKLPSVAREISKFFHGIVKETIDYRESKNISRNDFMQLLINIKNRKSITDENEIADVGVTDKDNFYDINGMTLENVTAQAFVFFVAGFETSSSTMSFALYELALNPDVQDRLRDEVDSVLADHDGQFTYEAMIKMTYLDNVVAEALRKYPPVSVLMRGCTKEYKVPGTDVVIEKGTSVLIPVLALQNDAQYFPEPEKFDPDRFTEKVKSQRHHYTYLPFGEGPRICIGSRFGMMQTKVGLASLISKYQFNVSKKETSIPLVLDPKSFISSPIGGIKLQITARN